ncbi:hypothetical protein C8R43DRAFT_221966 [Mycena crocata]|nr:hypothetical protein C8R43DRAFT_221966 [Mycena crocata]
MSCTTVDAEMFDPEKYIEECAERELRTVHNDLVPIARLPPEILAHIFVRCVPATLRELHHDFSWLNLTQVSARWRLIALACPDFWSTLILSRPKWTPVMLQRSKMASLVVRVDLKKDRDYSPEPILLENAARLGALDVRSPQDLLTMFISNLEHADAAPRLHCIIVVNTDGSNRAEGGMWLPLDLFRRKEVVESRKVGARQGVRLHLESAVFPWQSAWYSHLTHLHLENINPAQRPTMEAFLCILVGSPALQTLTVIHCSPTTRHGFTVDLPHLSALTLKSESSSMCARLVGYINIPPSATLRCSCTVKTNLDTRHAVYQTLIPEFSDLSPDAYDTVRLSHKDGLTLCLLDSARPEWFRKLYVHASNSDWSPPTILRGTETVLNHLDFSNVTTLHLTAMEGLLSRGDNAALWNITGRRIPRLRVLHLHKSVPAVLFEFLLTQALLPLGISHFRSCYHLPGGPPARGPDGGLVHAWPALQRLALHELDLSELAALVGPSSADALRALLWARRASGAPVWQLEIEDCTNVYTLDLGYFRLFADVVWDGKGEKTSGKDDEDECLESFSVGVFGRFVDYLSFRTSYKGIFDSE